MSRCVPRPTRGSGQVPRPAWGTGCVPKSAWGSQVGPQNHMHCRMDPKWHMGLQGGFRGIYRGILGLVQRATRGPGWVQTVYRDPWVGPLGHMGVTGWVQATTYGPSGGLQGCMGGCPRTCPKEHTGVLRWPPRLLGFLEWVPEADSIYFWVVLGFWPSAQVSKAAQALRPDAHREPAPADASLTLRAPTTRNLPVRVRSPGTSRGRIQQTPGLTLPAGTQPGAG